MAEAFRCEVADPQLQNSARQDLQKSLQPVWLISEVKENLVSFDREGN